MQLDEKLEDADIKFRQPPHNITAEQMLLGAILTNNETVHKISDYLSHEHFYEPIHAKIYEAVQIFMERGIIANPVTLKNYFDKENTLEVVGGANYLAKLCTQATAIINANAYAQTIYDLYLRRKLISIGENVVNDAYEIEIEKTSSQQIESAEQELFELDSQNSEKKKGFVKLKTSLGTALERIQTSYKKKESVTGISTGFIDLDELLGGLQDSDLLILAGRPSMGKTALSVNIALNACQFLDKKHKDENNAPSVGFFSLEMSAEQLASRMLAMVSNIDASKLRTGKFGEDDFSKLIQANKTINNLPFYIDDTPALSISALRTRARRLKRKYNLGLLTVDYLQLVKSSTRQSQDRRVQEISEITQGLKAIAKELNVPVLALSQLSRAVEQREDKRPLLSDLRESGSIEQDADIVLFIFREDYYLIRKQPREGTEEFEKWASEMDKVMNTAEVIVAKQRNGPVGNVKMFFDHNITKFSDLDQRNEGKIRTLSKAIPTSRYYKGKQL